MSQLSIHEIQRLDLQSKLDSEKSQEERNRLGQFATPTNLAYDILKYAKKIISTRKTISLLDPGIGTGAFYSALLENFPKSRIKRAIGFEIDPHYAGPAEKLWKDEILNIKHSDFTKAAPPKESERFNLLICNPPYVRHHHLINGDKIRLQEIALKSLGIKTSRLTGLYCYFMFLSHNWMADDGLAGWLIPSEFMDVNYGNALKKYLLNQVSLIRIHRFDPDDVQFNDALVSSAVVWFKKRKPLQDEEIMFSYGGSLLKPKIEKMLSRRILSQEKKWTRFPRLDEREITDGLILSDLFTIKRGLATGSNNFFILNENEIIKNDLPMEFFKPILPSPRYLEIDCIESDNKGLPLIPSRQFLLDCSLSEEEVKNTSPKLWNYLLKGINYKINEKYLCRHRNPWYSQEKREPAPIMCTYMGRTNKKNGTKKPFRFILNKSRATAANVYLMLYPKPIILSQLKKNPDLIIMIWEKLKQITAESLLENGRVYGGGLHKLEPKELANVPADEIIKILPDKLIKIESQKSLF